MWRRQNNQTLNLPDKDKKLASLTTQDPLTTTALSLNDNHYRFDPPVSLMSIKTSTPPVFDPTTSSTHGNVLKALPRIPQTFVHLNRLDTVPSIL